MSVHWTGQPFVDAGLAALLAASGASRLSDVTATHLDSAVRELERILLSDQALGIGLEKSFAKGTLSQVFPNSELVNPSNWSKGPEGVRAKYRTALKEDLARAKEALHAERGDRLCGICGELRPSAGFVMLRRDRFPLLSGAVNFYPGFVYGVALCGLCALALRFSVASLLRVGERGRLWFLHCPSDIVAARIAQEYGWGHFRRLIAANQPLDFYGDWRTSGNSGAILCLLCQLLRKFANHLRTIYQHGIPTVAYVFSNDNRGGYVEGIPVPTSILDFLQSLYLESIDAFDQFERELLRVDTGRDKREEAQRARFVAHIADRIIRAEPIVGACLGEQRLLGGWIAHRTYLREVNGMNEAVLALLERTGIALAQHERGKKLIGRLERAPARDVRAVLLDLVREGVLSGRELAALLPPNEPTSAQIVRDVLLAVVYEYQRCNEVGESFPRLAGGWAIPEPDEVVRRLERIAADLIRTLPNRRQWIADLMTARRTAQIRATYLRALRSGAMSLVDFLFLVPLGDVTQAWVLRDYLLAFLFELGREAVPTDIELVEGEEGATDEGSVLAE